MPASSGSLAFLGAARFQGFWDATAANLASGSGLDELAATHEAVASGGLIYGLFATGTSPASGYNSDLGLSAAIGDYWQVTGAGNFNVDGANSWGLNDWCIYSGSIGAAGGKWTKLAYQDTIASILVGGGVGGTVTAINNQAADRLVTIGSTTTELDGEANLTFNSANLLTVAGNITASVNISGSGFYGDGANLSNVNATTVTITDNESTDEANAIVFTAGGDVDGGNLGLESDGDLTYNPSSGLLSATNISCTTIQMADTAVIKDAGGHTRITFTNAGDMQFNDEAGNATMVVDTAQRIGIGTTSPDHDLEVVSGGPEVSIVAHSWAAPLANRSQNH